VSSGPTLPSVYKAVSAPSGRITITLWDEAPISLRRPVNLYRERGWFFFEVSGKMPKIFNPFFRHFSLEPWISIPLRFPNLTRKPMILPNTHF
jgi:hypothetical protein